MNKIADTERFVDRDPVVVSVVPPPSLPQYGRYRALIAGAGLSILLSVGFIVWTENRESAPKQQLPVAVPPLIAAAPIVSATLPLRTSLPDGGAISADSSADQDARLLGLTALDSVGDNQLGPGDLSGKGTLAHRAPPNTDEEGQISASTRKESPPIKEGPLSALDHIPSSQAHAHIGQVKRVCGRLAKWREISSGMFINFDLPYPNDVMSAVIWRKRINEIGQLELIEGQDICVSGLIQTYRGKPQIEVENRDQITP